MRTELPDLHDVNNMGNFRECINTSMVIADLVYEFVVKTFHHCCHCRRAYWPLTLSHPHTAPYRSCGYCILRTRCVNFWGCAKPTLQTDTGYTRPSSCARKHVVKSKYISGLTLLEDSDVWYFPQCHCSDIPLVRRPNSPKNGPMFRQPIYPKVHTLPAVNPNRYKWAVGAMGICSQQRAVGHMGFWSNGRVLKELGRK